ncbi:Deoxynucleoside triphosphate triphosphohydrolase SAMHD1 [Labeo rohita]|uniref:Deoxynucleoside triphosphate triphosphohydrolase SAMHD1 n=1 Tax=Labeo rohita TaxID=84645 RepID=A0ABQ8KZH0_LABRO|nr:Deoxynucleoside triphosphate triphosphohydrolase SAMHD1 [Labeo rohita]
MFQTRYILYSQAYEHKIVNIIEEKIIDALLEAKDKLPKISPISVSKLQGDIKRKIQRITGASSDTHEDDENSTLRLMKEFAKLTGARKKLEDVVKRCLPKCVGETRLGKKDKHAHKKTLQNDWNEAVDEWNRLHPTMFLDKKDFSVDVIQLHCTYSTGINPIENVYFYRKRNPTEAFKIKKYEVSSLLPEEFTEYVCRIYHTKNSMRRRRTLRSALIGGAMTRCVFMCKILVYDQEEFRGNECLITGDCPSLDDCGITEVHSCKVHRGFWKLYEGPNYNEAEYTLEPEKEYRTPTDWDCQSNTSARSLKHIFNDPIHGHIELHPLLVKIINTPQFILYRSPKLSCFDTLPGFPGIGIGESQGDVFDMGVTFDV